MSERSPAPTDPDANHAPAGADDGAAADQWPPPPDQRKPGRPISTAGGALPFGLDETDDAGPPPVWPHVPGGASAADVRPPDAPSTAPPGFTPEPAVTAASAASANGASPDAEAALTTGPGGLQPIGGSLLLARAAQLRTVFPSRADLHRFGVERGATLRICGALVAAALLLGFVAGPALRAARQLPIIGPAADQLRALILYPETYGLMWVFATLLVACGAGLVVAQMERTAENHGTRADPAKRLNIALTGLLVFAGAAALLMLLNRYGWAAAGSATAFSISLWLVVPVGRTPGGLALAHQTTYTWTLLLLIALVGLVWAPSLPLIVFAVFALMRVRARRPGDEPERDPVDRVNRISGSLIVIGVLVLSVVGLKAMTLDPDQLKRPESERPPELRIDPPPGESLPEP